MAVRLLANKESRGPKGEIINNRKHYMDMRFWRMVGFGKLPKYHQDPTTEEFNTSYLVLQAMTMWGNDRQMKFVGDAKILRRNFVIDLLSYEDNSCRYTIPANIQQRLIDMLKKIS
uniref:Uncharacterized protein n=1 Tax=Zea mays TaxID=4577 RepID=A0A804UAV2_MAIZE